MKEAERRERNETNYINFLIGIMCFSFFAVDASAYEANENVPVVADIGSAEKTSALAISSSKAICKSSYYCNSETAKTIKAVQTLEKKSVFGNFTSVSGASWTKTVTTQNLSMNNTKSNLSSGTYRLKTVFTVTLSNGTSETVTVYSAEKTVN